MDSLTLRFVFDRKGVTKKEPKKEALIQLEVYDKVSRRKKYISTDEYILKTQYSPVGTGGLSIIKHPNAAIIKARIDRVYNQVQDFIYSERCGSIDDVENWNKQDVSASIDIVDFIKADLKRRDVSYSVIQYNNSFIKRLEEYGQIRTFDDLSYDHIMGLDACLRKTISSDATLFKRHSLFKGYIQEAINRGVYKGVNPYVYFKNKKGKPKDPLYLTEEELQKLTNYSPDYGYLERTKDLYLFQCYTGLAYVDLMEFKRESVSSIDGHKIIRSNRVKTDENYITLFLPEAERIAEKYDYDLPKITNQKYNEYLKQVGERSGINKPLVSHSARHSFATLALSYGMSIESVSKMLGHNQIRTTQIYAKVTEEKIAKEMVAFKNRKKKA